MLNVIPATNTVDIVLTGTITTPPEKFITHVDDDTNSENIHNVELASQEHGYTYRVTIRNTCFVNLQSNNDVLITYRTETTQEQHRVRLSSAFTVTHVGEIPDEN